MSRSSSVESKTDTGLRYFDCFATVGPRDKMCRGDKHTLDDLLESMDRCGIDAALVSTTFAQRYDVMWGNRWLSNAIKCCKRLYPMWVALPDHTGECPPPNQFLRLAQNTGVRAVRIYPKDHRFSTSPLVLGPLMKSLAEARMPLFVDIAQFEQGYPQVQEFLRSFRANIIAILGVYWDSWRFVLPLLEEFKNFHMEFSSFQANDALEEMVRRFGSSRFLFGSDAPQKSPGAARALIDWSDLPEKDRRAIAHGNLQSLLCINKLPTVSKAPADDIVAAVWQGKPLDMINVFDAHAHVLHPGGNGVGLGTQLKGDAAGMKRLFYRIGVRRTAVSAWLGIYAPEPRMGNDITHEAMLAHPDFVIGYACVDLVTMSPGEIRAEIELRHLKQGFLGLKPYIRTSAEFNDPGYRPWYSFADKHRLFGLFHEKTGLVCTELAPKYPHMSFLLAHSGASMATAARNAGFAAKLANVYCEITITNVTNGAIELLVSQAGSDKVLFGTDAPMRDPRPQLGWAVHADISRAAKVKLLGANFARILRRCRIGKSMPSRHEPVEGDPRNDG